MSEGLSAALTIAGMVLAMVAILFAAYYTTRLLGRQYGGLSAGKNAQVRVIERVVLGRNESLCVVLAAGKTLLVGVTPSAVTLVCELEDYELDAPNSPEKQTPTLFYQNLLNELKKRSGRKPGDARSETDND